jgi:hypothetical protein
MVSAIGAALAIVAFALDAVIEPSKARLRLAPDRAAPRRS